MSESEAIARWHVPHSWSWVEIGNICDVIGGGTPSTSESANFADGDIPWITPADLSGYTNKYIESGTRAITSRGLAGSGARLLPAGTVLFSSRAPIGYVAIAKSSVATNQGFKSFVPPSGLTSDYLYYYLQHAKRFAVELSSGTTFQEISGKRAAQIPLAVAPEAEQPRIVEKLEELLSDLDAGVAALERARSNLKRYRAAVLKAAVDGRLTEKWRAAHPDAEPAEKLLERILVERRKKWEKAQLEKFAEKGQAAPKGWKDKYPEPIKPDVASLPALPSGWIWASLEQLIVEGPQNGLYLPKEKYRNGIPILRIDDYQNDSSRSSADLQQVQASSEERETYELRVGDILVNRVNSPSHLGKCIAIQERHVPALFESNMMRFAVSSLVRPDFVIGYLRSVHGRVRLTCNAKWAVNQASINQQDVLKTPVPLPSPAEQTAVVEEMEHRISVTTASELEARVSVTRSARLRQSILKRAFEGKLVPQDPKDEPASELLARIRAIRAVAVKGDSGIRKKMRLRASDYVKKTLSNK